MKLTLNHANFLACLVIFFLGFSMKNAIAQSNKESAAQMVEIGDEIFNQTQAIMEARELYLSAVDMDSNNVRANYMAGVTTLQSIDKGAATKFFLRVLELNPEYSFDILYKIGSAYHFDYKFDEAINFYSRYKQKLASTRGSPGREYATAEEAERKLFECDQGKIMIEFPVNVEITNAGPAINSPSADYAPIVNQDETMLIFTSRRREGNLNPDVSSDNYPFEDIFVSTKNDGVWSVTQNIGQTINTLYHDANVGLSKDGTTLFIYKDANGGDIFAAKHDVQGQWTEPEPMGKPFNTKFAETTVSLSPDGQTLFFASDRKGGVGGLDIWLTTKNKKGGWDDPVNLGGEINTAYDEDGPFIGYDGKTLYFSSQGGAGMGGYDIYRVTYDSLSNIWGTPQNIGYPINTPDHDIYFVPTKNEKNAYFSSVRDDGFGNSDIYMLGVPEVPQHQEQATKPTVTLSVKVYDNANNLLDASLQLYQLNGNDRLYFSRQAEGDYNFISRHLESRQYQLIVASSGFESQQVDVTVPGIGDESLSISKSFTLLKKAVRIPPVVVRKPDTSTNLRNIYFDFNKSVVMNLHDNKVSATAEYLKSHPADKLLLTGHSDLVGTQKYNVRLSKKRAKNVKKAIVANGIAASRIQIKGEGHKYPLASNDQEMEGRELNRRVEFKILN